MAVAKISVRVFDTEDRGAVEGAVRGIFPTASLEGDGTLHGETCDLSRLKELLREQRIRGAARTHLVENVEGRTISFSLSKQAALVDRVNFGDGRSPLGDIDIVVETEDPIAFIEDLTEYISKEAGEAE